MVFSFGLCFANSTTLMNKHQFDVPWWRFEYKWTRLSQILWSFPCDFLLLLDSWLRDRSTPPFPIVQHTFIRSHYWFYHTWLILLSFHSPLPSFLDLCSKTLLAWHVWKKKHMKDNPKYMFQIGAKLDSMIYEQNMNIFGRMVVCLWLGNKTRDYCRNSKNISSIYSKKSLTRLYKKKDHR